MLSSLFFKMHILLTLYVCALYNCLVLIEVRRLYQSIVSPELKLYMLICWHGISEHCIPGTQVYTWLYAAVSVLESNSGSLREQQCLYLMSHFSNPQILFFIYIGVWSSYMYVHYVLTTDIATDWSQRSKKGGRSSRPGVQRLLNLHIGVRTSLVLCKSSKCHLSSPFKGLANLLRLKLSTFSAALHRAT